MKYCNLPYYWCLVVLGFSGKIDLNDSFVFLVQYKINTNKSKSSAFLFRTIQKFIGLPSFYEITFGIFGKS